MTGRSVVRRSMCLLAAFSLLAIEARAERYPFDAENWDITGQEVELVEYKGQNALRLLGGSAIL